MTKEEQAFLNGIAKAASVHGMTFKEAMRLLEKTATNPAEAFKNFAPYVPGVGHPARAIAQATKPTTFVAPTAKPVTATAKL